METPVKHTASTLRAMLKEHKASMPRLSAKKHELLDYAGKIGLLKAAEPPSPPPEPPAQKKKSGPTTAAAPASVKSELPKELKKPAPKQTKTTEPQAPPKKALSESAKGGLAAYATFVAEKKARGMSHKEATEAWKARK